MRVDEIKNFVDYLVDKDQSGNSTSPSEINLLLRRANFDIFKLRYGLPEEYQAGGPFPRMAWQLTQKMTDDLDEFIEQEQLIVPVNGRVDLPTDYLHKSALWYRHITQGAECDETTEVLRSIEVIADSQWANRASHSINIPNKKYPICRFRGTDQIEFLPKDLQRIELIYLRLPKDPVWGFTIDTVNDVALFDADTSTNPEWPADVDNDFVRLIMSYNGINLSSPEIVQYAETIKAKGV